jgi:hypothetical protein
MQMAEDKIVRRLTQTVRKATSLGCDADKPVLPPSFVQTPTRPPTISVIPLPSCISHGETDL